jgi:hypothetical protein
MVVSPMRDRGVDDFSVRSRCRFSVPACRTTLRRAPPRSRMAERHRLAARSVLEGGGAPRHHRSGGGVLAFSRSRRRSCFSFPNRFGPKLNPVNVVDADLRRHDGSAIARGPVPPAAGASACICVIAVDLRFNSCFVTHRSPDAGTRHVQPCQRAHDGPVSHRKRTETSVRLAGRGGDSGPGRVIRPMWKHRRRSCEAGFCDGSVFGCEPPRQGEGWDTRRSRLTGGQGGGRPVVNPQQSGRAVAAHRRSTALAVRAAS